MSSKIYLDNGKFEIDVTKEKLVITKLGDQIITTQKTQEDLRELLFAFVEKIQEQEDKLAKIENKITDECEENCGCSFGDTDECGGCFQGRIQKIIDGE